MCLILVPLDKPEEFMNQLTKMKHFKERLECWLFQDKFSEIIYGIGIMIYSPYSFVHAQIKFCINAFLVQSEVWLASPSVPTS
jgi:hypothetical protein